MPTVTGNIAPARRPRREVYRGDIGIVGTRGEPRAHLGNRGEPMSTEDQANLLTAMARYFATPKHHYQNCPECMSEDLEVVTGLPSDGHNIEIHILKRCLECDWMRAAKFEAETAGRPPTIQPNRADE